MPNFADILDKSPSQTEKVPVPPTGTYTLQVSKLAKQAKRGDYEVVDIPCKAVAPGPDVDMEALATYGGIKNIPELRVSFLFDSNDSVRFAQTENRMKKFFEDHLKMPDAPYKVLFNDAIGHNFMASTRVRIDDKTGDQYFEIDRTAPAE